MKRLRLPIALSLIVLAAIFSFLILNNQKISNTTQPSTKKFITKEELKAEQNRLEKINTFPDNKQIDPNDYPISLGVYEKNNLKLVEVYHCSDLCPDAGGVHIFYEDVKTESDCANIPGEAFVDPAFRVFRGCAPIVK